MQDVLNILKARAEELEAEVTAVNTEYDARIDAEVEQYRAELIAKYAADRETKCYELGWEVEALRRLIAKESAKVEVVEPAVEVEAPAEAEPVVEAEPIVELAPVAVEVPSAPVKPVVQPVSATFPRRKFF